MTDAAQPSRGARVIAVRSILSPLSLVVFLFVPVLALYVVSSATVFAVEFDSRKTLSPSGLAYFGLALLLFAAGAKAGDDAIRFRRRRGLDRDTDLEPTPEQRRSLTVLLEAALVVSVGAYALWFGLGIVRAGGVEPVPPRALRRLARRPVRVHAHPLLHEHARLSRVSRFSGRLSRPTSTTAWCEGRGIA